MQHNIANSLYNSGKSLRFQGTEICLYSDVSPWTTPELVDQGQRTKAGSAELGTKDLVSLSTDPSATGPGLWIFSCGIEGRLFPVAILIQSTTNE